MLYGDPCVFAVGNEYQVAFNTKEYGVAWVEVDGQAYRDSRNGLMRSETLIHKVALPMAVLDAARRYRVCFRALPVRRPYFPELGELQTRDYAFRPVDESRPLRAFMLADTHSRVDAPCRAAEAFGAVDLLLLNGDIPAESKQIEDIRAIYDITSRLTHGEIPVVFARGNHDCRGRLATELPEYIGTRQGETWFTFRMGGLWGIVLDCGEDKRDTDPEYGGLVDCHGMRLRETEFLKDVLLRADEEFRAAGVCKRVAICHMPFPTKQVTMNDEKFTIETELYSEWTQLLNDMDLDMMLCGHMHWLDLVEPGSENMRLSANFPIVIGSAVYEGEIVCREAEHMGSEYAACGITWSEDALRVETVDNLGGHRTLFEKTAETQPNP